MPPKIAMKLNNFIVKIDAIKFLHDNSASIFNNEKGIAVILTDKKVQKYCFPHFLKANPQFKNAPVIAIPEGEASKSLNLCQEIWKRFLKLGINRHSLVINLGGGVVTDLGGFAASTYKRGINFINVPTSLMGQVDAAIGGKVGINFGDLKNEIGLFNEPSATLIDPSFIATLPAEHVLAGFAEMLKHGLVLSSKYFDKLSQLEILTIEDLTLLIQESVELKRNVVLKDPFDQADRKCLNFGHTVAHAFESFFFSKDKHLLHGNAVAAGLLIEAAISYHKGLLRFDDLRFIQETITNFFEPLQVSVRDAKVLWKLMLHDKKNERLAIKMVALKKIGTYQVDVPLQYEELVAGL